MPNPDDINRNFYFLFRVESCLLQRDWQNIFLIDVWPPDLFFIWTSFQHKNWSGQFHPSPSVNFCTYSWLNIRSANHVLSLYITIVLSFYPQRIMPCRKIHTLNSAKLNNLDRAGVIREMRFQLRAGDFNLLFKKVLCPQLILWSSK